MNVIFFISALTLSAPSIVDEDVLEESVLNEVEHALDRVPANCVAWAELPAEFKLLCITNDFFATNNLSRTKCALKLVSKQRSDGRWLVGTNDLTSAAQEILRKLSDFNEDKK